MKNILATSIITLALCGAAFAQTGSSAGGAAGGTSGAAGSGGTAAGTTGTGTATGNQSTSGGTTGTATGTATASGQTGSQGKNSDNDAKFMTKLGDMAKGFFGDDNSVRSQDEVTASFKGMSTEQQTLVKEECTTVGSGGYGEQVTSFCGMLR